jgi:hypothetical protein
MAGREQPIADAAEPQLVLREQHQDGQAGHRRQVPRRRGGPRSARGCWRSAWSWPRTRRHRPGTGPRRPNANNQPPAGGPARCWPTVRAPYSWLLARSSRWLSWVTSARMSDWAALSNSVCALPSRNPMATQQRDGRPAGQHRHSQDRDQGEAAPVDAPHHPAPIPAVDQRAADQPEQQPGQPAGRGDQRDRQRVATERGRQQRQGGQNHPITGRRDGHGGPQPVAAGPELASGPGGSSTRPGMVRPRGPVAQRGA